MNKKKMSEYQKSWYQKNKQRLLDKRNENKEKIKEYSKTYYDANKEKISLIKKQYAIDNKAIIKDKKKEYYLKKKQNEQNIETIKKEKLVDN